MRPTYVSFVPASRPGMGYTLFAGSSITVTPGAAASASRASAGGTSPTNSTLMDSPWQRSTGTRTQVAAT